jgi:hypothetical protein
MYDTDAQSSGSDGSGGGVPSPSRFLDSGGAPSSRRDGDGDSGDWEGLCNAINAPGSGGRAAGAAAALKTSVYRGVTAAKCGRAWRSRIRFARYTVNLGK